MNTRKAFWSGNLTESDINLYLSEPEKHIGIVRHIFNGLTVSDIINTMGRGNFVEKWPIIRTSIFNEGDGKLILFDKIYEILIP